MSAQKQVTSSASEIYILNVTCKVTGCLYAAHGQYLGPGHPFLLGTTTKYM